METVRLSNGLTQYEGEVEIYLNFQWRAVCYDGWDEVDAKTVCREISYLSTSVEIKGILLVSYMRYTNECSCN